MIMNWLKNMLLMLMARICIYPQDVAMITGKGIRYGRQVIQDIKVQQGKSRHQLVTIEELCLYLDLPYHQVYAMINPRKPVPHQP